MIFLFSLSMGKVTKDIKGEPVSLIVKTDNQKFHLGTLNSKTIPHVSYCLVFDKEFELSHDWKYGEISFTGITMASELFSYPFSKRPAESDKTPLHVKKPKLDTVKLPKAARVMYFHRRMNPIPQLPQIVLPELPEQAKGGWSDEERRALSIGLRRGMKYEDIARYLLPNRTSQQITYYIGKYGAP